MNKEIEMSAQRNNIENGLIVISSNQVSTEVDGEIVLLNLSDGLYYGLDAVGARIWGLIQEPKTLAQILTALLDEYEVNPVVCRQDTLALLEQLAARDLIELKEIESV